MDRVKGVLGQHGSQELLVMLLLLLQPFALGFHLEAEGDKRRRVVRMTGAEEEDDFNNNFLRIVIASSRPALSHSLH